MPCIRTTIHKYGTTSTQNTVEVIWYIIVLKGAFILAIKRNITRNNSSSASLFISGSAVQSESAKANEIHINNNKIKTFYNVISLYYCAIIIESIN